MISKTKIAKRIERKTNPLLREIIVLLKKQDKQFWVRIADLLSRPDNYSVNLEKLNNLTSEKQTVIVPGKILASGHLTHSIKVSAFAISESAKQKLKASKSEFISLNDLLKQNPKGADIRVII